MLGAAVADLAVALVPRWSTRHGGWCWWLARGVVYAWRSGATVMVLVQELEVNGDRVSVKGLQLGNEENKWRQPADQGRGKRMLYIIQFSASRARTATEETPPLFWCQPGPVNVKAIASELELQVAVVWGAHCHRRLKQLGKLEKGQG